MKAINPQIIKSISLLLILVTIDSLLGGELDSLAVKQPGLETRWVNFENPTGSKGTGGRENRGVKGHAFDSIQSGETKVLFDIHDSGVINHIWLTIDPYLMTPKMLRSLRLDMFWDGAKTPAVSVPFGDFFGIGHGRTAAFETALFTCPEKRAFNSYVPMPFRKSARITLKNETSELIPHIFYTIHYTRQRLDPAKSLYFHASWRRELHAPIRADFEILPHVTGAGRFLGASIGVIANPLYGKTWWGEGEIKMYLDGDKDSPTLVGTGTEDYVGEAWGLNFLNHRYQGCLLADGGRQAYSIYRFHVLDPIVFQKECRVAIQQIGGAPKKDLMELKTKGVPIEIISVDRNAENHAGFIKALEQIPPLKLENAPNNWCNFFRSDDWCATAYFYLDRQENGLPPLADVKTRIEGIDSENESKRADP